MLRLRGKVFYSRTFVPLDVQPMLHKTEVVKSLQAADRQSAKLKATHWEHRVLALFARLRTDGENMSSTEIDSLVARYLAAALDTAEIGLTMGESVESLESVQFALQDRIETTEAALIYNRYATVRDDALRLLGTTGVDEDSDGFKVLCRRLLEAKQAALWAELRARQGQPLRTTNGAILNSRSVPSQLTPQLPESPLLSAAFAVYNETEGSRRRWRPATLADHKLVQATLLDSVGDKPVATITKAALLAWFQMIRLLPVKPGQQYKGMTASALVHATKDKGLPRLADKTVNARYLSSAKAFFNYAVKVDWLAKSPADALDRIALSTAVAGDKAFTAEELSAVFGGLRAAATKIDREGYYWVAVLALYSGARLDEIAGLRLFDVRQTESIWCLHINESGGRSLKNAFSARVVPIHSRVLALGFMDYFKAQRGPQLVGSLTKSKLGKFGGPVSKFFHGYLKCVGVKTSRSKQDLSLPAPHIRHTGASRRYSRCGR